TLSRATGIAPDVLVGKRPLPKDPTSLLPPLWLKARERGLGEKEYSAIAVSRLIATNYDELLALTQSPSVSYRLLFAEIKQGIDPQQPAGIQGSQAAAAFLEASTLGKGAMGIGEVIRAFLRARDILVLETPINNR